MTDPTTAILDLVRERGPMTWRDLFEDLYPNRPPMMKEKVDAFLASGALREVERREPCGGCRGTGFCRVRRGGAHLVPCYDCNSHANAPHAGTTRVTYLATPEQAAIMDVLRERPSSWDVLLIEAPQTPVGQTTNEHRIADALDALLASNWITRIEQERECGTCEGWGGATGSAVYDPLPCPACKDGRVAVAVYELVG
jgi:hypothetical protein